MPFKSLSMSRPGCGGNAESAGNAGNAGNGIGLRRWWGEAPERPTAMYATLVGRGSRTAKKCFRSSRRSHALGSVSPRDAPSSRIMMCHPLELGPDFRIVFPCSSRSVWLGERVSLAHNAVGTNLMPCDYRLAVREPRPHHCCSWHSRPSGLARHSLPESKTTGRSLAFPAL